MLRPPFESAIDPVAPPGTRASRLFGTPVPEGPPPPGLVAFYWYFVRQAKVLFLLLFVLGMAVAMLDALIPIFIGSVIGLLSIHGPDRLLAETWPQLLGMAAVLLIARPLFITAQNLVVQQGIGANVTSLIRWQSHFHVVRQGWTFFQEDFAGRIANRVMQAGPALRESVVQGLNAVWYIIVYGSTAVIWLSQADLRLAVPVLLWFCVYIAMLFVLVPRMRDRSRAASAERSLLTGRVVDS